MASQTSSELDSELLLACKNNRRNDIEALVHNRQATDAQYVPPVNEMMAAAASKDAADVVAYCLDHGATVLDPVLSAIVQSKSFSAYRVLVEAKAVDIDRVVPWYGDILGVMACANQLDWVRFSLEHGANPNMNLVEEFKTPLAGAAELGNQEMVELLLGHGAWVKGSGAIVLAAEAGKIHIVKLLLSRGADIDEIGVQGPPGDDWSEEMGSPLHKAITNGHVETALFLIEAGANTNLEDGQGRTPEALANKYNLAQVADSLSHKKHQSS